MESVFSKAPRGGVANTSRKKLSYPSMGPRHAVFLKRLGDLYNTDIHHINQFKLMLLLPKSFIWICILIYFQKKNMYTIKIETIKI